MVFTLVAYHENKTAASLLPLNACADQHVTVAGDDITVPILDKVMASMGIGAALVYAQLASPSLRTTFLEDLAELDILATIPVDESGINDFIKDPIPLVASEKLNFNVQNAGAPDLTYGLVWLCDRPPTPINGDIHTIMATNAGITSTTAWANGALVLSQTLPAGRYALVGARMQTATATIAYRFVFPGYAWRPGFIPCTTLVEPKHPAFRRGGLGVWGEFEFDQPPTIDVLAPAATGAIVVYLDLIQIRKGR